MSKKAHKSKSRAKVTTKKHKAVVTAAPVSATTVPLEQNGVRAPIKGVCRDVWDALDKMRAGGIEPTSQHVKDLATANDWNQNNATIELGRWRRFHGLTRPKPESKPKVKAKLAPPPTARTDDAVAEQLS